MCQQNQIKRFIKKLNRIIKLMSKKNGAWGRTWTGTRVDSRRILSPVRLPIPPLRHIRWCPAGDSNSRPFD